MVLINEIATRSINGELIEEKKFDLQRLSKNLNNLKKEYGIHYDPEILVSKEKTFAKNLYDAAVDLLVRQGVYCTDTNRIIKVTHEEIAQSMFVAPSKLTVGRGIDSVDITHRSIGSTKKPTLVGGPCGGPMTEDMFLNILFSHAKEPGADILHTGCMTSAIGEEIKMNSPSEMVAARLEGLWSTQAAQKANRPGMARLGAMAGVSATSMAFNDFEGGLTPYDLHMYCLANELKVDWSLLNKMMYHLNKGNPICPGQLPVFMGLGGDAAGTAIVNLATAIEGIVIGQGKVAGICPIDMRFSTTTTRELLWIINATLLSLSECTHALGGNYILTAAGGCSDMLCFEAAAEIVGAVASGAAITYAIGPKCGAAINHSSGMDSRISDQLLRASLKINPDDANALVKTILSKYEKLQLEGKAPIGKPFQESYTLPQINPTNEHLAIWAEAKKELENLGLQFG